jgi:hypothetical protein
MDIARLLSPLLAGSIVWINGLTKSENLQIASWLDIIDREGKENDQC